LTIRAFDAGVRRVLRGTRGNCTIDIPAFKIPKIDFDMLGMDTFHMAEASPAHDLAAFQVRTLITDAAAGDITIGDTYATGAISGGTKLQSVGISINMGVTTEHYPVLGGEAVLITGRAVTGKVTVALNSAEEVALWTAIRGNTAISTLGITWGATAGRRITIFGTRVQRSKPKPVDIKGRRFFETELRFLPTFGTGNNELRGVPVMDDLDLFFPVPVVVRTRAGDVALLPLTFDQMAPYFRAIRPIADLILAQNYFQAVAEHPEAAMAVIMATTPLTAAQVGGLHADDFSRLLEAIIVRVNGDFMVRCVIPALAQIAIERADLLAALPQRAAAEADGPPLPPILDGGASTGPISAA